MAYRLIYKEADDKSFTYRHAADSESPPPKYKIHAHEVYEIVIFFMGDASFIAEGMVHPLNTFDAMLTKPGEMHQIFFHSSTFYERIVITFTDKFFIFHDCMNYRNIFTEREIGKNNVIASICAQDPSIMNIISIIERYITDKKDNENVIRCALVELLYALNQLKPAKGNAQTQNLIISNAIAYINTNLSDNINLEVLAAKCFVSKYYLCHLFKKHTGLTLGEYITQKRLLLAKSLCKDGHTLSEAASLAGFDNYSSFYKAFTKKTGTNPQNGLVSFMTSADDI